MEPSPPARGEGSEMLRFSFVSSGDANVASQLNVAKSARRHTRRNHSASWEQVYHHKHLRGVVML